MEIAQEILRQLGGPGRLKAMINAKGFLALEDGLRFKHMPGQDGVNMAEIKLNGRDLYNAKFYKVRGQSAKMVAAEHDIFVEDLAECFRRNAGLAIRL